MRCLIVAGLILTLTRWSTAEINAADSIEWATADSDRVVVGRVATVTEQKGPGRVTWYQVTFAVSETLKGPIIKSVDVSIRQISGPTPVAWKTANAELMLFLVDGKRCVVRDGECHAGAACTTAYGSFALRSGRWGESDAYKLDGSAQAFTMEHAVLRERADLIAAVRGAAKSKANAAFQIDLPLGSPAGKVLYGGSTVFLYVPIDARLEQSAIQWLGSSNAEERDQGIQALAYFKSPANQARIEQQLPDPATHDVTEGEGTQPTVRRFFVRKRAHEVLRAWGVPHPTPPLETPLPKRP